MSDPKNIRENITLSPLETGDESKVKSSYTKPTTILGRSIYGADYQKIDHDLVNDRDPYFSQQIQNSTVTPYPAGSKTIQPPTIDNSQPSDDTPVIRGHIYHYDTYILNGKKYQFKEVISDNSGEADIFLVTNNNRNYIFKLYFPDKFPNIELMNLIKSLGNTGFLMQVIDLGLWKDPKSGFSRNFEIMEYMLGETLAEYDLKKDPNHFRSIAMQCAMAIDLCHQNGFIHNDIKPSNFFFKEESKKTLILGDFGIAAFFDKETGECRTRQSRTPTFAAPEIYSFVIDNEIIITPKADYFSLGIVLICLWSNITSLVDNERLLVNMKRFGDLPYPKDIPADLLQLLKGLTVVDPDKRWGFDEISRWFNGEEVEVEKRRLTAMNILYRTKGNWVVNTPEDLAKYMMMDRDLAIKYLYSGRIMRWLIEGEIPELAMGIENIIEKRYPKVQEAGLYASIYLLDPALPYRDINGKDLSSWKEIAQSLISNLEEYKTALTNPDHSLYIYLNSSGEEKKSTELYNSFLTNGKDVAIWNMIYTLDPELPYYAECIDRKQNIFYRQCYTTDELITAVRENRFTDRAWKLISSDSFLTWLNNQNNPALHSEIKNFILATGRKKKEISLSYTIIYLLNPEVSFNLYLPQEREPSVNFIFTPTELGKEINKMIASRYLRSSKDDYIETNLESLKSFHGSRIWSYLFSKGWNKQIDLINTCFDLDSDENRSKNGPYNENIATYKVIKGLGYSPFYYFHKSKEYIFDPGDLANISPEERRYELEHGLLKDWLTIFFQENPQSVFPKKFDYERTIIQYLETIRSFEKDDPDVKKYSAARKTITSKRSRVKIRYASSVVMRFIWSIVILLPLFLSVAILIFKADKAIIYNLSPTNFSFIALLSGFIFVCHWLITYLNSFRKSLLVSISLGMIIYYTIYILTIYYPEYIHWLIVAIFVIVISAITMMLNHTKISNRSNHNMFSSKDFKINYIEPLQYVYKQTDNGKFVSSVAQASSTFLQQIRSLNSDFIKSAVGYTILSFAMSFVVFDLNDYARAKIGLEQSITQRFLPIELYSSKSSVANFPLDEFDKKSTGKKASSQPTVKEEAKGKVKDNTTEDKGAPVTIDKSKIQERLSGTWSGRVDKTNISISFKEAEEGKTSMTIEEKRFSRSSYSYFDAILNINDGTLTATSSNDQNTIKGRIEGNFNSDFDTFTGNLILPDGKSSRIDLKLNN